MVKISVIGAGNIGTQVAFLAMIKNLIDEVVLLDVNLDLAMGKALDILQARSIFD